jgi:protein phosphatase PTC6
LPLTTTHHPSSPSESRRLRRYATAFVSDSFGEERFGVLANTRSFGDVSQKRLGVSAEPEVYRRELGPGEYSFMVLVSDGVSGTLTDQEIVDIVKECRSPEEGAKELVEFAEEVASEGDNATAVVVRLGGWEKRAEGGEGFMGTKDLRAWRRDEALVSSRGRRM